MRLLITILLSFTIAISALAYDYSDNHIQLTILDNGNWELQLDGINYQFTWYDLSNNTRTMKVTGDDGTCYWHYEVQGVLETSNCDLESLSIMFSRIN